MSESTYAFRRSTSEASEANIHNVMSELLSTLDLVLNAVEKLEPSWIAVEADTYYNAAKRLNKGAQGVVEILQQVESALKGVRMSTDNLRGNMWSVLSQW